MASSKVPNMQLNSGHEMPVVGYGTFNLFKENEVRDATRVALEVGYRHIDTAWVYKTEAEVGDAITPKIQDGSVKRSDLFITTKLWNTYHHPDDVEEHCRDSLAKLQTDYLDLYLMHWPFAVAAEDKTAWILSESLKPSDIDYIDTWRAMEELVIKGLVKTIGVSNFNIQQLKRLLAADNLRYKPAVNQVEVHPYYTNNELLDYCKQENIVVTAYSPLGKGGAAYTSQPLPNILEDAVVTKLAAKYNKSPAQVVLRWAIGRGYTVVPKSVTPSRIKDNLEIFDFALTEDEIRTISGLDRNFKCVTLDKFKDYPEYPFTWLSTKK
ncbi:hypothetical protein SNE40_012814 [Patella caerulea]|uniref:NADP-dependent oxidoreductase domain-containing protein n=1 Tax=Patella caerulea TaxID=87958 RepID=A0AAN8PK53_PATCE